MKKITLISIFILIFANSAWSLYIYDEGYVDVGNLDDFIAAATKTDLDNANTGAGGGSGDANEFAWMNQVLLANHYITTAFASDAYEQIDTSEGAGWFRTYHLNGTYTLEPYTFAYDLGSLTPAYYIIKTGNLAGSDCRWFLFSNNQMLDWAVINLQGEGYNLLGMGKISHIGAPVPEPTTLILLGAGLIGVAGLRRKIKK